MFITGHTFSQILHLIQNSLLIEGYKNPSLSSKNVIAPLGHASPQTLHPQHSFLSSLSIITSTDY